MRSAMAWDLCRDSLCTLHVISVKLGMSFVREFTCFARTTMYLFCWADPCLYWSIVVWACPGQTASSYNILVLFPLGVGGGSRCMAASWALIWIKSFVSLNLLVWPLVF